MTGTLRIVGRLLTLTATLCIALALHGAWRLCRQDSPWPRRFLARVSRIVGADVQVVGVPLDRDVVFAANHLSWIDILLLGGSTGAVFVAKAELARAPLVGWLAGLNDTLFVERGDRMGVAAQIERLRRAIARGRPVAIFPEGTTGDGAALLPFKPALLGVLDPPPPGIRVQPVRIDYGAATRELAWAGDETGVDHARRVLARYGRFVATLTFCEPFDPGEFAGRKAVAHEARRRIETAGGPSPRRGDDLLGRRR